MSKGCKKGNGLKGFFYLERYSLVFHLHLTELLQLFQVWPLKFKLDECELSTMFTQKHPNQVQKTFSRGSTM